MSNLSLRLRTLVMSIAVAVLLAACSAGTPIAVPDSPQPEAAAAADQDSDEVSDAEVDRVINVVLTEFAVTMDGVAFVAGETVKFEIVNEGAIVHEFRLSNAHRIEEHMASKHSDDDHDASAEEAGEEIEDLFIELDAGERGTLVVTFPDDAGAYTEAACLIPGHYEADMTSLITVDGGMVSAAGHDEGEDAHAAEVTDDHEATEVSDADVDRVINVVLTEFAVTMDETAFVAGETVKFMIVNEGAIEHEFRLSNAHRIEEHMASDHSDDDHDAAAEAMHEEIADMFLHLDAGETGSLVVTFPHDAEAFTEAACLIPGHYEANMTTTVTVAA